MLEYKDVFSTANTSPKAPIDPTGVMISTIWSVRYCKGKSGCLGALASNGEFKVFETKHEYSLSMSHYEPRPHQEYDATNKNDRSILTKRIHQVELPWDDKRKGRPEKERIVAFDFTSLAGSKGTPCAIVLRGDHSVGVAELNGAASALTVSPFGNIVVSKKGSAKSTGISNSEIRFLKDSIHKVEPQNEAERYSTLSQTQDKSGSSHLREATDATNTNSSGAALKKPRSSRESHERVFEHHFLDTDIQMEKALALVTIARRRAVEGYLFNCEKNIEVLRNDRWLRRLWIWIGRK